MRGIVQLQSNFDNVSIIWSNFIAFFLLPNWPIPTASFGDGNNNSEKANKRNCRGKCSICCVRARRESTGCIQFTQWLRIGINFGNLKLSIWALGFHLGLCAIFGLYACYWLKLNMFETLKWLAIIGLPTLICGNRLLHSFSSGGSKKQKPE